jgi:hypothetical protein
MFKGASQNMQRQITTLGKAAKADRLRKVEAAGEGTKSRAMLGKLKNLRDGEEARAANLALKAKLRADAVDPAKASNRAKKIVAKQTKRMASVIVEIKGKTK